MNNSKSADGSCDGTELRVLHKKVNDYQVIHATKKPMPGNMDGADADYERINANFMFALIKASTNATKVNQIMVSITL